MKMGSLHSELGFYDSVFYLFALLLDKQLGLVFAP